MYWSTILDFVHYPQETILDLYIFSNFFVKSNTQATTHPHKQQHSNHTPTQATTQQPHRAHTHIKIFKPIHKSSSPKANTKAQHHWPVNKKSLHKASQNSKPNPRNQFQIPPSMTRLALSRHNPTQFLLIRSKPFPKQKWSLPKIHIQHQNFKI